MDKIGPYFIGSPEKGLTLDKINAMPPKQKSVHLQSIQTINLHSAALEDSLNDEETLGTFSTP
jgi:hypothetical protein